MTTRHIPWGNGYNLPWVACLTVCCLYRTCIYCILLIYNMYDEWNGKRFSFFSRATTGIITIIIRYPSSLTFHLPQTRVCSLSRGTRKNKTRYLTFFCESQRGGCILKPSSKHTSQKNEIKFLIRPEKYDISPFVLVCFSFWRWEGVYLLVLISYVHTW